MSKATKAAMEALHKALADTLKDALENGEVVKDKETGEAVRVTPSASTMNVIRQFLKDNGIEAAPGTGSAVDDLGKAAAKPNLPFPTQTDEHGLPN